MDMQLQRREKRIFPLIVTGAIASVYLRVLV
jgi:hypothetical protein